MPGQTTTQAPVTRNERIQYLDILRGIAILLIFLASITYLSGIAWVGDILTLYALLGLTLKKNNEPAPGLGLFTPISE